MQFLFRRSSLSDIGFYAECFCNDEFQYMLYRNDPVNVDRLERYIIDNGKDLKFVGSVKDEQGTLKDIGFAHFYYKEENAYTYVGGICPKYFNHGYGIYASVAILSLIRELKPGVVITTGIYKHNLRSLRADLAIGFTITSETYDKFLLRVPSNGFDNDFVKLVKRKISYQSLDAS